VHRTGSNVVNGRYFVDYDPKGTIAHYSSFRQIDVDALRNAYADAKSQTPEEATRGSALKAPAGSEPLAKYFALAPPSSRDSANAVVAGLDPRGYWLAPLGTNSHPYTRAGSSEVAPGDYSQTHVGDETDTSPYPDDRIVGISTTAYVRNMSVLIRALDGHR
jgi:hypothetical protein